MKTNNLKLLPIAIYCLIAALWSEEAQCMDNSEGRMSQEAAAWYREAAVQGNPTAQTNLGWMYKNGCGVNQSDIEAAAWYHKAAVQGNLEARLALNQSK